MDAEPAPPLAAALIAQFAAIVGEPNCIWRPDELRTYECDGNVCSSPQRTRGTGPIPAGRRVVADGQHRRSSPGWPTMTPRAELNVVAIGLDPVGTDA